MCDLDLQKVSPPLEEMLKFPKEEPPASTTVETTRHAPLFTNVAKTPSVAVAEMDEEEHSDDVVASDFGELSIVEPEAMDDNDYGLM